MRLLITGGAGFIGSNLILHLMAARPDLKILNLDKLTYAADPANLAPVADNPAYAFRQVDLADRAAVREAVRDFRPEGVMHLAAESHVDNSIKGPEAFVMANVVGTFNLLEECRQLWNEGDLTAPRFLHVSTDEVFGTLGDTGLFSEETPYAPNSPYSATKAGSDFLVRAYHHTYGMNVVMTNCSNNYGPHQHDEKLIPTVIRHALKHEPIPVYGQGTNVRDWLFVRDHCDALETVFFDGVPGRSYNVGGENEWTNIDLVRELCHLLDEQVGAGPDGAYANLISFVTDRPGHDFRYAIDATRLRTELGWNPSGDFRGKLRLTVQWYCRRYGFPTLPTG